MKMKPFVAFQRSKEGRAANRVAMGWEGWPGRGSAEKLKPLLASNVVLAIVIIL